MPELSLDGISTLIMLIVMMAPPMGLLAVMSTVVASRPSVKMFKKTLLVTTLIFSFLVPQTIEFWIMDILHAIEFGFGSDVLMTYTQDAADIRTMTMLLSILMGFGIYHIGGREVAIKESERQEWDRRYSFNCSNPSVLTQRIHEKIYELELDPNVSTLIPLNTGMISCDSDTKIFTVHLGSITIPGGFIGTLVYDMHQCPYEETMPVVHHTPMLRGHTSTVTIEFNLLEPIKFYSEFYSRDRDEIGVAKDPHPWMYLRVCREEQKSLHLVGKYPDKEIS